MCLNPSQIRVLLSLNNLLMQGISDDCALIVSALFNFLRLDGMSVIPRNIKPGATKQQEREMLLFSPE